MIAFVAAGAAPETPPLKLEHELRLRWEGTDSPSATAARDSSYELLHARYRLALEWGSTRIQLRTVLQGAASFDVPIDAAFGSGAAYASANPGDPNPQNAAIAELALIYKSGRSRWTLGRQAFSEGAETPTGLASLDQVKRRRLSERLIGGWDWVNVGRRFEGLRLDLDPTPAAHWTAFVLRPLAGGMNFGTAFDRLDGMKIAGLSATAVYGKTFAHAEPRLFAFDYRDDRPAASAAAGGPIEIRTLGTSWLFGNETSDLFVWVAAQHGDWGSSPHRAWGAVLEAGRTIRARPRLVVRGGLAHASGDSQPGGDHETFHNLLPTNHKFYGSIDYLGFQNLRNYYLELSLGLGERWKLRGEILRYDLVELGDAWYSGSGAADDQNLGFPARRPAAHDFPSHELGYELDLEARLELAAGVAVEVGLAHFAGGEAAGAVLPVDEDGTWGYVQVSWRR